MRKPILAVALVAAAGAALVVASQRAAVPEQPVAFSHRVHAEMQLACAYCHALASSHAVAGIPRTKECASCHWPGHSAHPEIRKIEEYMRRNQEIPWVRVARLGRYNIFTHEEHIEAGLECAVCHGDVASMDRTRRAVDLDMSWCVACHEQRGAGTDCLTCHK